MNNDLILQNKDEPIYNYMKLDDDKRRDHQVVVKTLRDQREASLK